MYNLNIINLKILPKHCDLYPGVELLFEKEGQQRGSLILKQGLRDLLHTFIGVEECFMQRLSAFFGFFCEKERIIEFFDFLSYGSEWTKRKTKIVVDMPRRSSFERCSA